MRPPFVGTVNDVQVTSFSEKYVHLCGLMFRASALKTHALLSIYLTHSYVLLRLPKSFPSRPLAHLAGVGNVH